MTKKSVSISATDPKYISQKHRTKLKNQLQNLKKEKMEEELNWMETDKKVIKKMARKEEKEIKKIENVERKVLLKKMADSELDEMEKSTKKSKQRTNSYYVPRVTQAQIEESKKVIGSVGRTTHISSLDAVDSEPRTPKNIVKQDYDTLENVNRLNYDIAHATNVEDAISVLSSIVGNTSIDSVDSPLKRSNTSTDTKTKGRSTAVIFAGFKERELSRLKVEHPTLKFSQLNQMVIKLWAKSADNPANII